VSLRWKFLIVVHAAVVAAVGLFLVIENLFVLRPEYKLIAVVWAIMVIAILWLALLTAYRTFVGRPLLRILDGAERLAQGDRSHRIDLEGGDEMAAIAQSINRLAERAAISQSELENQVAERTSDLRAVIAEVHERSRIVEEVNRKLHDLDRRRSEFLSNVSHELRTPLNSVLGFLRLLQDGMYESEEERREFLENARVSASHLLHLVQDVLSATQIEAGMLELGQEPLHPGDVIHDVLRVMEIHARDKDVRMRLEVDGRAVVLADPGKLRQILINLVSNAIKFTEHGEIVLRTTDAGDQVRFEVSDTGHGIPLKELEKIFEKFHQIDTPSRRAHGGTGMGLAICRQLVQLMGGEIGAQSDGLGKGATIWFTLPSAQTVAAADAPSGDNAAS